ncbi:MAG: peptidoglycan-binding protein [Verrucomicrobiota bacterium]|nr:peptidoglycan-binding protein [Verrucomicrobiota bacterium]
MSSRFLFSIFAFVLVAGPLCADDQIRQVQEELRKRNLYFGDIDGRATAELVGAVKRYQTRKGFEATGRVDEATAASLHLAAMSAAANQSWPDVPVLRSDVAREIPEAQQIALANAAEANPDASPNAPPPAESPAPSENLTPDQVNKLVEDYLRDGETEDVAAQIRYYAFPVNYFDHGPVDENFVAKDTRNYLRRWPDRKYTLTAPVTFVSAGKEGETLVEFTIAFDVRSKGRVASGRTKNFWTLRAVNNDPKIVAIREEHLRN